MPRPRTRAREGNVVAVFYKGSLEDGTVFDSNVDGEPLEFTLGDQKLISGFEKAVLGMRVGETIIARIPPDYAYGAKREDLVISVDSKELPEVLAPEIGQMLHVETKDGGVLEMKVSAIEGDKVILDANHPLAGKELIFEITLEDIR